MYCINNLDTLKKSINTIQNMHSKTTWNEKLCVGKIKKWYQ